MEYSFELLMASALRYIARRKRARSEIHHYLVKKTYDHPVNDALLLQVEERLQQLAYINDREFARSYIVDAKRLKKRGESRIIRELIAKGIDQETIGHAMEQVLDDTPELEEELLASELAGKWILKNKVDKQEEQKFLRRLMSRGISYEVARGAIDAVLKKD